MAIEIPPSPTVEATSLAPVLHLAAHPPTEPVSHLLRAAPLVLYIARVPGSRDVFLTPIKPREKVVTASDVQSSLYYVHIHGTGSGGSTELPPRLPERPVIQNVKLPPPLPRRPVPPSSPPYPPDEASTSAGGFAGDGQRISRKPPLPTRSKSRDLVTDLPVLPPRPLPPAPPQYEYEEEKGRPSLHEDNVRLLTRESQVDGLNNPYVKDYSYEQQQLQLLELDCRPSPGTLTLIRRDPGSNEQWNVATIHDPPIVEISSSSFMVPTAKRRTKKGGAPLYLDILNPGYNQFINSITRTESSMSASTTTSSSEEGEPPSEGVFRRRLYMPGSRYGEHGYSRNWHRKQSSASMLGSMDKISSIPSSLRGERHSVDLGAMNGTSRADRRAKGYTFMSPWDGQCEFVTGPTGRTLKCRHHLPPTSDRPGRSMEVSELRFNLPSPAKNTPALFAPRSSYFAQRPHLFESLPEDGSQSPTLVINEDGRIDLTLGQEKAGGGFGGKQAKLGKLIIEPEGFGMLDLLVASNVGLWFRAWEKS